MSPSVRGRQKKEAASIGAILRRELSPPFSFSNLSLDITPLDYVHVAQTDAGARKITVRSPLTWIGSLFEGDLPGRSTCCTRPVGCLATTSLPPTGR